MPTVTQIISGLKTKRSEAQVLRTSLRSKNQEIRSDFQLLAAKIIEINNTGIPAFPQGSLQDGVNYIEYQNLTFKIYYNLAENKIINIDAEESGDTNVIVIS